MTSRIELVLGPPGCGKTTTLIGIVEEELARGVAPDRIGYVSFTRRAAQEAVQRACAKFGRRPAEFPYFRTIHSLCFRALGMSSGDVLEGNRLLEFSDLVGMRITGRYSLDEGSTFGFERGDRIMFMENLARVRMVPLRQLYDEDDDELSWPEVDRVSRALHAFKESRGLLDYTDMLAEFMRRGHVPPLEVLLVDEAQDQAALQWSVVDALARGARRVVVAGDDDQAIYRWAGADVEHLVSLEGDARVLAQSWRVPRSVQRVASDVVGRIRYRREKVWAPRPEEGSVEYLADFDEVSLAGDDILVLARNAFILRAIERMVRRAGYMYEFRGARSIRQIVVDAVRDWTTLTRGGTVTAEAAARVYEMMSSGRGVARGHKTLPAFSPETDVTLADLQAKGGMLLSNNIPWFDALDRVTVEEREYVRAIVRRHGGKLPEKPSIRLSTIHGMKGGEADRVVLLTDMARRTYEQAEQLPDDEARVWYVAVTRARRSLEVIRPKTSMCYDI